MIADSEIDLSYAPANPLWTRPIMFYYAAAGPRDRLLACVDALTAVGQTADHVEAAALALTRAAFAAFARFCRDHQIFPEFHFSLDLEALRRMPPRVFGILMSLEPAIAALIGFIALQESLHWSQWIAVVCVVAASAGATRSAHAEL